MNIVSRIIIENNQPKDLVGNTLAPINGNLGVGAGKFKENCIAKNGNQLLNITLKKPVKEFALSVWVNILSNKAVWQLPVARNNSDFIYITGNSFSIYLPQGQTHTASGVIYGKWYHIYILCGNGEQSIYINGEKKTFVGALTATTNSFTLGGSTGYSVMDGKISDFTVWGYARPFTGVPKVPMIKTTSLYIDSQKRVWR